VIVALRRLRMTAAEIAETLAMPLSTVSAVLTRNGLGRLGRIGLEQPHRYERSRPGELVHIDVKKLGRITRGAGHRVHGGLQHYTGRHLDAAGRLRGKAGWEFVHVAVDDYSRLAYAEVLPDEKAATAIGFLRRALAFFARYGIQVERVLTDNGSPYISTLHALACRALGIRHLRTRPRRPQTNGKAERFIRTLLAGWAYGAIYRSSQERTQALDGWPWHYNHRRRHSALGHQPPASRTNLPGVLHLADDRLCEDIREAVEPVGQRAAYSTDTKPTRYRAFDPSSNPKRAPGRPPVSPAFRLGPAPPTSPTSDWLLGW
jgi:transposase InsO family protein